jgi:hypothetical protein
MAVDWSAWPLLEVRAADLPPAELHTVVGAALGEAISRGEAFVAVVQTPDMPRRGRVRGAVEQVRTVRRLRPGMAEHCRGLAMVLPPSAIKDNEKVIRSGPKIWGCPVNAVSDLASARTWALGQLENS